MSENIENIIEIDENTLVLINGVTYSLNELNGLITSCAELAKDNDFLQRKLEQKERMLKGVKLNNSSLTLERNNAIDELNRIKALGMYEFASKYCSSDELEEAGHALARSLGVGQ